MAYFRLYFMAFMTLLGSACKPKEQLLPPPIPGHLQKVIVLCFHDIVKGAKINSRRATVMGRYAISLKDFTDILAEFDGFRVVSLRDWVAAKNPEDLRPRIVLTFDDGYAAHREIVLPELLRRGFGATFYFYAEALQRDKKWIEIAATESRMDFGSHSWSHALLKDINYDVLFRELYLARTFLEASLSRKIESFAWPYGYYSSEGARAAESAGFAYQVSVDYRIASRADIAKVIPRYTIFGKTPLAQVRQILKNYSSP